MRLLLMGTDLICPISPVRVQIDPMPLSTWWPFDPEQYDSVLPVMSVTRRPRPGLAGALGWTIFYGGVLQIALAVGTGFVSVILHAIRSGDPVAFLMQLQQPQFRQSAAFQRLEFTSQVLFLISFPIVGACTGFLLIRLTAGRPWMRRVAIRRPAALHLVLAISGLPALAFLSDAIVRLSLLAKMPTIEYQSEIVRLITQMNVGLGVLVIALGPAFAEELWCRAFFGRGLVGRYGYVGGVLLTSFFFGLMHIDPPHVVATFAMGICLHCVYLATRSLWIPMLLHFLNNLLAVLSVKLWQDNSLGAVINEPSTLIYGSSLILAIATGNAFFHSRARLASESASTELTWQPSFPGVECPPAASGIRVMYPWPGWRSLAAVAFAVILFLAAMVQSIRNDAASRDARDQPAAKSK